LVQIVSLFEIGCLVQSVSLFEIGCLVQIGC